MSAPPHGVPDHVQDNIVAMAELRADAESEVSRDQRAIEAGARALGRPATFYVLLAVVVVWIGANVLVARSGGTPLDPPPFAWLQLAGALYAVFVSTLVLVAQSRQSREDDRRAHLELHLNLLAEQKTTKIIGLLEELRRDLPNVRDRADPIAEAMQEEVDPKAVHSALAK